ncbi:hypothetical protein WJR50_15405 [Catalinimonas sp. 4WD22]|uniref:hypothetical protein n=1 Tax=Catalinimonas locisalis TaxID=3133978 RepID=UPI003100C50A
MKILSGLLIVLSVIIFSNCRSDAELLTEEPPSEETQFEGTWELRSSHGGLLPGKEYAPGSGFLLHFNGNDYYHYAEEKLVQSGTFELVKEEFFYTDRLMDRIIYDDDESSPKTFLQISGDTLYVYFAAPIAADGIEKIYIKLNADYEVSPR